MGALGGASGGLGPTALATCMVTVINIKAQQKGYDIPGMKVSVEKHMSEDSPRRIVRLRDGLIESDVRQ